jgi:hypothetical protein
MERSRIGRKAWGRRARGSLLARRRARPTCNHTARAHPPGSTGNATRVSATTRCSGVVVSSGSGSVTPSPLVAARGTGVSFSRPRAPRPTASPLMVSPARWPVAAALVLCMRAGSRRIRRTSQRGVVKPLAVSSTTRLVGRMAVGAISALSSGLSSELDARWSAILADQSNSQLHASVRSGRARVLNGVLEASCDQARE